MKLRFPLYLKIAAWLVVNLLLIAVLLGGFLAGQYHLGLDSLLAGRAGDRVNSVADVIATELRAADRSRWDAVLEPFSDSYGVRFSVHSPGGQRLAGDATELPAEVRAKLSEPFVHREPHPPRGPRPQDERTQREREHLRRDDPDHPEPPPGDRAEPPPPPAGRPLLVRTASPTRYWVMVRLPVRLSVHPPDSPDLHEDATAPPPGPHPGPQAILVALSDSLDGGGLFFEWTPWLLAAGTVLVVSILCWMPLVRGLTRALRRLTDATSRIAEGRFDVRVAEEKRGDELGALAGSVNRMAARLDGFVTGQKRFLGDIAHELCAPLARLQMSAGILEQRATPGIEGNLADLREEIEQMSALVDELLSFSRASLTASTPANLASIDPRPIVTQAIRRECPDNAAIHVNLPGDLRVRADPDLLLRAVSNVLRNCQRHATGSAVEITAPPAADGRIALKIRDHGPGVPPGALTRLFDPFFRPDPSRDRLTGGAGLGLAIVKTCIEACDGTISGRNAEGGGFEVVLHLGHVA